MKMVLSQSGAKILQFNKLRRELFYPQDATNKRTDDRLVKLAQFAAQGIFKELHDEKKATLKYLSITKSPNSWAGCSEEAKTKMLGREATNDRAESALGGTTQQIQAYGRIGLANAAAISDAKQNGYFSRFTRTTGKAKGMFRQFPKELWECILMVAIEDAPTTMSHNREEL